MAASNNDNQGLKIAVAALVMLVFILGVTNYFAFSSSSQMTAKAEGESKKAGESEAKARTALEQANYWKERVGYGAVDDNEAAKAAFTKDMQRIVNDMQGLNTETVAAINEIVKAGEPDPKLDDLRTVGQGLIAQVANEPNENRATVKSVERFKDLSVNMARVVRETSLDYLKLRRNLESTNSINAVSIAKTDAARDSAVKEKQDEQSRIKSELQSLYDQITNLQNSDKDKANTIVDLNNKLSDSGNALAALKLASSRQINDLKTKLGLDTNTLGKAIGAITFVDYSRGEVRVNLNRSIGAQAQMTFTVFDKNAQGIGGEKPKGTIQLTYVGDPSRGETDSVGRIVETKKPTDPIRRYDQIYSPAFTPDSPQRYALVGRIDINRDGRDDRGDLIRLIEQAGGLIEYDLPPPGVDRTPGRLAVERAFARIGEPVPPITGRASGRIDPGTRAYIVDYQMPLNRQPPQKRESDVTEEAVAFNNERTAATKDALAASVPAMRLERLLDQLGYTPVVGSAFPGTLESKNPEALKMLLKPRATNPGGTTPPASPDAAQPKSGMP